MSLLFAEPRQVAGTTCFITETSLTEPASGTHTAYATDCSACCELIADLVTSAEATAAAHAHVCEDPLAA